MAEVRYVCPGSCGGMVTQEDYDSGKITCADPNCEKHGHALEKRMFCNACQLVFLEGEEHDCGKVG
ncbi:MAG: hypothetical protein ACE5JK_02265 [Candidatus Omnitrophota bacterium]